jgi:hypothetical protein
MSTAPRCAADPRPNNRPFFIDPLCDEPGCNTPLVLGDLFDDPTLPPEKVWYDEWVCPIHPDKGIFMDWPQRQVERLRGRSFDITMEPEKMIELGKVGDLNVSVHPLAMPELLAMIEAMDVDVD